MRETKPGPPRTTGPNKVRQIGRWTDSDWELIRRAAEDRQVDVATWAKAILLAAALKRVKE